jgi:hypothetical protein
MESRRGTPRTYHYPTLQPRPSIPKDATQTLRLPPTKTQRLAYAFRFEAWQHKYRLKKTSEINRL